MSEPSLHLRPILNAYQRLRDEVEEMEDTAQRDSAVLSFLEAAAMLGQSIPWSESEPGTPTRERVAELIWAATDLLSKPEKFTRRPPVDIYKSTQLTRVPAGNSTIYRNASYQDEFAGSTWNDQDIRITKSELWVDARMRDCERVKFVADENSTIVRTAFRNVSFRTLSVPQCHFQDPIFENVDVQQLMALGSSFANAVFKNVRIKPLMGEGKGSQANFTNARFTHSMLSNMTLGRTTTLDGAVFTSTTLRDLSFSGSELNNVIFCDSIFDNVDFSACDLRNVMFVDSYAVNCVFEGCEFEDVVRFGPNSPYHESMERGEEFPNRDQRTASAFDDAALESLTTPEHQPDDQV